MRTDRTFVAMVKKARTPLAKENFRGQNTVYILHHTVFSSGVGVRVEALELWPSDDFVQIQ